MRCPAQDLHGEQSDAAKERAPRLCSTRRVHGRLGFVCVSSPCPLLLFTTFSGSLSPPSLPLSLLHLLRSLHLLHLSSTASATSCPAV